MVPGLGTRGLTKPGQVVPPSPDLAFLISRGLKWPIKLPGNLALIESANDVVSQ